jgi:hypothetical protein
MPQPEKAKNYYQKMQYPARPAIKVNLPTINHHRAAGNMHAAGPGKIRFVIKISPLDMQHVFA